MSKKRFPMALDIATAICDGSAAGTLSEKDLRHQIVLGRFPAPVLQNLHIPDLDVVTSVAVLAKLAKKHDLKPTVIAGLHNLICAPKAVYGSASRQDSLVILTMMLLEGNPLIASVVVDTPDAAQKPNMHWLTSAYGKDNHFKLIEWERAGLLLWKP